MESREMLDLFLKLEKALEAERKSYMSDLPPLRPKDIAVLEYIWNADGHKVKMSDLTAFMGVSPAATSQLINQYEQLRLAERQRSKEDRRANFVQIHPEFVEWIGKKTDEATKRVSDLQAFLGEEDTAHCVRILTRLQEFAARQDEAD